MSSNDVNIYSVINFSYNDLAAVVRARCVEGGGVLNTQPQGYTGSGQFQSSFQCCHSRKRVFNFRVVVMSTISSPASTRKHTYNGVWLRWFSEAKVQYHITINLTEFQLTDSKASYSH